MKTAKASSPYDFWASIERVHGEIPKLVKLVLRINGFDSLLSLKGFRYDEKEFFASLEKTVKDFLTSDFENNEKLELSAELAAQYQSASNFCIKPGHRYFIINLMREVEKTEPNELMQKADEEDTIAPLEEVLLVKEEPFLLTSSNDHATSSQSEHGQSRREEEHELEYEYEEYLSNDESIESIGITRVAYEEVASTSVQKSSRESHSVLKAKRRPEHMYNNEFMAKSVNPRRRRVALNKIYANTREGIQERFRDLLFQSMECILPLERMPAIGTEDIQVEKSDESDTIWIVYCPICNNRIRLAVVHENSGRYCNYKRSNFERHLRFKHCKGVNKETL